jgi:glucosamine-6-phosphate deaminase
MKENFYRLVDADQARIHVPEGSAPDPEAECERYEAAICEAGGAGLCVLGIGATDTSVSTNPVPPSTRVPA